MIAAGEASKEKDREMEKYKIDLEMSMKMMELIGVVQSDMADKGDSEGVATMQKNALDWQKHMTDIQLKMKQENNKLKMNKDNNETKRQVSKDSLRTAVVNK